MMNGILTWQATNVIEMRGPVTVLEPEPYVAFQTIDSGTTVTGRLMNIANDAKLVALVARIDGDHASGVDAIAVDDEFAFGDGDTVTMLQDDGEFHTTTVSSTTTGVINLDAVTTAAISNRTQICRTKMATTGKYFSVDSLGAWKVGDTMIQTEDDFTIATTAVDQVLDRGDSKILRVEDAPLSTISNGMEIKNQVGATITDWADYGTPAIIPGSKLWGFRASILPAHLGLRPEMFIRGEIVADDGAGVIARANPEATVKLAA